MARPFTAAGAWSHFGEGRLEIPRGESPAGTDLRFTTKGDALYVFALAWPGSTLKVKMLGTSQTPGKIARVEMLGNSGALTFARDENSLDVRLPNRPPSGEIFVFKISGLQLKSVP